MKKKQRSRRKLNDEQKKMIAVIAMLMILIVILSGYLLLSILFSKPEGGGEIEAVSLNENTSPYHVTGTELERAGEITIIHSYIPWGSPRRPGEIREIRYITIHETDNRRAGADAKAHNNLLITDTSEVTSWHYTVDDSSVYHNIPDNEIAWNAGDGRTRGGGNINGIGIEMCVNLTGDFEQTLKNTAALAGELLTAYDLDMTQVRFHEDFMNKECPHRLISEGRTEEFLQMIRVAYTRCLEEKKAAEAETESEKENG